MCELLLLQHFARIGIQDCIRTLLFNLLTLTKSTQPHSCEGLSGTLTYLVVVNSPALESDVGWIRMSVNEVSVLDDQYTNTQKDIVWWDVQLLLSTADSHLLLLRVVRKSLDK